MNTITKWQVTLSLLALAAAVVAAYLLARPLLGTRAEVKREAKVAMSPTMVERVSAIGQWEFLSISDEELVDTVRHGFLGDDELVRIYYGTLRLGIDMGKLGAGWAKAEGDSLVCVLPLWDCSTNGFSTRLAPWPSTRAENGLKRTKPSSLNGPRGE